MKPSDFLKQGNPSFSIFGKTEYEVAASAYMDVLVNLGDKWQNVPVEKAQKIIDKIGNYYVVGGSVIRDKYRFSRVISSLQSSEDALSFSPFWKAVDQKDN